MDKRIGCSVCPLLSVELDTLCEEYCSDMADYREEIRADAIDECIKTLAESEDTILSDGQYYTLMELKEQNND